MAYIGVGPLWRCGLSACLSKRGMAHITVYSGGVASLPFKSQEEGVAFIGLCPFWRCGLSAWLSEKGMPHMTVFNGLYLSVSIVYISVCSFRRCGLFACLSEGGVASLPVSPIEGGVVSVVVNLSVEGMCSASLINFQLKSVQHIVIKCCPVTGSLTKASFRKYTNQSEAHQLYHTTNLLEQN